MALIKLKLKSGEAIEIGSILHVERVQFPTGLVPTSAVNSCILKVMLPRAITAHFMGIPEVILNPCQESFPTDDPMRDVEELPKLMCVALAICMDRPSRPFDFKGSRLVIAWMQDKMVPPISRDALKAIAQIPWKAKAQYFDYGPAMLVARNKKSS